MAILLLHVGGEIVIIHHRAYTPRATEEVQLRVGDCTKRALPNLNAV